MFVVLVFHGFQIVFFSSYNLTVHESHLSKCEYSGQMPLRSVECKTYYLTSHNFRTGLFFSFKAHVSTLKCYIFTLKNNNIGVKYFSILHKEKLR